MSVSVLRDEASHRRGARVGRPRTAGCRSSFVLARRRPRRRALSSGARRGSLRSRSGGDPRARRGAALGRPARVRGVRSAACWTVGERGVGGRRPRGRPRRLRREPGRSGGLVGRWTGRARTRGQASRARRSRRRACDAGAGQGGRVDPARRSRGARGAARAQAGEGTGRARGALRRGRRPATVTRTTRSRGSPPALPMRLRCTCRERASGSAAWSTKASLRAPRVSRPTSPGKCSGRGASSPRTCARRRSSCTARSTSSRRPRTGGGGSGGSRVLGSRRARARDTCSPFRCGRECSHTSPLRAVTGIAQSVQAVDEFSAT